MDLIIKSFEKICSFESSFVEPFHVDCFCLELHLDSFNLGMMLTLLSSIAWFFIYAPLLFKLIVFFSWCASFSKFLTLMCFYHYILPSFSSYVFFINAWELVVDALFLELSFKNTSSFPSLSSICCFASNGQCACYKCLFYNHNTQAHN